MYGGVVAVRPDCRPCLCVCGVCVRPQCSEQLTTPPFTQQQQHQLGARRPCWSSQGHFFTLRSELTRSPLAGDPPSAVPGPWPPYELIFPRRGGSTTVNKRPNQRFFTIAHTAMVLIYPCRDFMQGQIPGKYFKVRLLSVRQASRSFPDAAAPADATAVFREGRTSMRRQRSTL